MNVSAWAAIIFAAFAGYISIPFAYAGEAPNATQTLTQSQQQRDLEEAIVLLDNSKGDSVLLEEARTKLDGVLRSDPLNARAHREYVRYHIMDGYLSGDDVAPASLAAAERSLNRALEINPEYAEAFVLAGHLYFLQKRFDDAWSALRKAEEIGTTDPWLPLNMADLLVAERRLDEAQPHYEAVISSGTTNSKAMSAAFAGLIRVHQSAGRFEEQAETYRQQIAYEPESAWPYGNYASFLLCRMDDAEAAIIQFRNALERMNYGMARSGLAAALYRKWIDEEPSDDTDALLREAQRLRDGPPVQVVVSFCRRGPAVMAVLQAHSPIAPTQ